MYYVVQNNVFREHNYNKTFGTFVHKIIKNNDY